MTSYLANTNYVEMNSQTKLLTAIAYAEEFRWWPPPPFTLLIIVAEIVLFLYHFIFLATEYGEYLSIRGPLAVCSKYLYHPHRKWEWWRFFTYAFVHSGAVHLVTNLLVFVCVGQSFETIRILNHNCNIL